MYRQISSLQNPIIKHAVKLRQNHDYRLDHHSLLAVGNKIVKEVITKHKPLRVFSSDEHLLEQFQDGELYHVTREAMAKLTGQQHPEELALEMRIPAYATLDGKQKILALDRVCDPGNVGTLIRTALALGWEGVFLLPGSCDPYNEKTIRSSMGAVFHMPLRLGDWKELEELVNREGLLALAADLKGDSPQTYKNEEGKVLVLGNEAQGLSPEALQFCKKVTIPMKGAMESLNVSVAGGILLYVLQ